MRIAFVGQKCLGVGKGSGGVERHVGELASRLALRGHSVVVFARKRYAVGQATDKVNGLRIIFVPTIYTKHLEAITHTFFSTLRCLFMRLDVIHFQGVGPALLSWMPRIFRPRIVVVVTFHSQDRYHLKWGVFARLILHIGEWMACKIPHATIVVSHGMQVLVRREYGAHAVFIPNGALLKSVYTTRELGALGLKPKEYILTVGRLLPVKGIHYLIPAYRRVKTTMPLIIVGAPAESGYLEHLKSLTKGDARIRFVGYKIGQAL
ncbi:MAG: glycosyltransferase family 4 protein, partial [Patescibacteria group bacterium]